MRQLDELTPENLYAELPPIFWSRHRPDPLQDTFLVHFNARVAKSLGIDPGEDGRSALTALVAKGEALPGIEPMALCYAGHQFGQYVPRLGDGRALLIGQVVDPRGERHDLQLKGSGRTLYSRQGDGRAVLRSTIREHLASAAMEGLGIPTTRSLALFGSGEPVFRERVENGALLIRVAPSHFRFGSFEYFFYTGRYDDLRLLLDFTIRNYFPTLAVADNPALALLEQAVNSTAQLIARWQGVGFCHGVMNTDNMSIHGITIDYGPYGFLDAYEPGHICNHSDYHGRYAYDRQPSIGLFNLSCLGQALLPLVDGNPEVAAERATEVLRRYEPAFDAAWLAERRRKLGLAKEEAGDPALWDELLALMESERSDFTNTFRALGDIDSFPDRFIDRDRACAWTVKYRARLARETVEVDGHRARIHTANPKYVLRNYLAEQAIRMAEDEEDYGEIDRLVQLLGSPFDEQHEHSDYATVPPEWASKLEVSCSS